MKGVRYNKFVDAFSLFDWKRKELVFVGVVLVAIFLISAVQLKTAGMKARDVQRKADADLVARAISAYYDDHKGLPVAGQTGKIILCGSVRDLECEWGKDALTDSEGVRYLNKLPVDPQVETGKKYMYETGQEPGAFRIYVALEYKRDAGRRVGLTMECGFGVQCNWYAQ